MPCTNCARPYTFRLQEQGCSNCGFGFCRDCLRNKVIIPQLAKKPVSVCRSCCIKLTSSKQSAENGNTTVNSVPLGQKWWNDDDLPPPSMRNSFPINPLRNLRAGTSSASNNITGGRCDAAKQCDDKALRERLERLKEKPAVEATHGIDTISQIEERLANLKGVSLDEVRHPSLMVMDRRRRSQPEEPTAHIMKKAISEAEIERKWDPVKQLEQRYSEYHNTKFGRDMNDANERRNVAATESNELVNPDSSVEASGSVVPESSNFLLDEDSIGEEISSTLKSVSDFATGTTTGSDECLEKEMQRNVKLARQCSAKNEKIAEALSDFWYRNIDKSESFDVDDCGEVDDEVLKRIIHEAEMTVAASSSAVREVKERENEQKSSKKNIFSRIFRYRHS